MIKSVYFWSVFCLVLLLSGLGAKRIIDRKKPVEASEIEPEPLLLPVRVEAARRGTICEWIYGEGTARPVQRKFLNFGQSGEVALIGKNATGGELREGSRVKGPSTVDEPGQLLARLDQRETLVTLSLAETALQEAELQVTVAEANARQAEHDYEFAKADFERVSRLNSEGTSLLIQEESVAQTREQVAAVRASVLQAESDLQLAKARLESSRKLSQARTSVKTSEEALIRAQEQVKISEAALEEARNNHTLAREDFVDKEALFQQGIISRQQYKQAQNTLQNTENALKTHEANLQTARSNVKSAEIELTRAQIDTPISGLESAKAEYQRAEAALQSQQANLLAAQSRLKTAEVEFSQAKINLPITEYEAAKNKYLSAETVLTTQQVNLQSARLRVKEADARLRQAELALEQSSLFAPFDGIITRLNIHSGDYVTAHAMNTGSEDARMQSAAIVVINPDEYEIVLQLPAFAVPAIREGQLVRICPGTEGFPDESMPTDSSDLSKTRFLLQPGLSEVKERHITGRVYAVSPSFSEEGRSVLVKIRTEEGAELLKDGMFVSCRIIVLEKTDVVLMPSRSLISREGEDFVFVALPESGEVVKRQVRGGIISPLGETEVLTGLQEGELVVVNQRDRLTDGSKVKVIQ
jgi:RND family efflux transporter MFP subunit